MNLVQREALKVDPAVKICSSLFLRKRCELFMTAAPSKMWLLMIKIRSF